MTKRENILRTITRTDPAWIPYRYDGSLTFLKPKISVRPVEGGRDDWGGNWIPTNEKEGSYPDGRPVLASDDIGGLAAPGTDFSEVTDDLRGQIERLKDRDSLVVGMSELTLFERAELLLGTDELLVATALDPDLVRSLFGKILEYQLRLTESLMNSGVSGVRFTDDWGTQGALFISPERWRLLVKPALRELYGFVKSRGGLVFQHSCGHIGEIIPDLIEIGVDVMDPCQPSANDIFGWKRMYGDRLCFMGGLDTQSYLSFGDAGEVRRRVVEVASFMGEGGGYIAAPSHSISIPQQNLDSMLDALREVNENINRKKNAK